MTRIYRHTNNFLNKEVGVVTFWLSSFFFFSSFCAAPFSCLSNQIKYIPKNTDIHSWRYRITDRYIHTAFLRCFSLKRKSWGIPTALYFPWFFICPLSLHFSFPSKKSQLFPFFLINFCFQVFDWSSSDRFGLPSGFH